MRFFENTKGSISIFLVLVLVPMYSCAYLAIDSARYSAARIKINGAMELAANAGLAGYDESLRDLFGVFAVSSSEDELTENLSSYFSKMIDTAELPTGDSSFAQTVINTVINEVIGAKPYDGAHTGTADRTSGSSINTSTVDFSASFMPDSRLIDTSVMENQILNFMKYRAIYSWSTGLMDKLSVFGNVDKVTKVMENSTEYYSSATSSDEALKDVFLSLSGLGSTGESTDTIKEKLIDTLSLIDKAEKELEKNKSEAENWQNSIDELPKGEIKSLLRGEYDSVAGVTATESIERFRAAVERDIERIEKIQNGETDEGDLNNNEAEGQKGENTELEYMKDPFYSFLNSSYGALDTGGGASGNFQGSGQGGENTVKSELSQLAGTDMTSFYEEKADVDIPSLIAKTVMETIYEEQERTDTDKNTEAINKSVDTTVFKSAQSALSGMAFNVKELTYKLFEAEYFTEMFSCLSSKQGDINLLGKPLCVTPIFAGEAEYIIFGRQNSLSNISAAVNGVFALRLIMNSLYAFTNTQMRQTALSVAAVVSGWSGIGVKVAQNLLLVMWCMAESVLDTASLCKGETVPIYKNSATWTLSLSNISETLASGAKNYAVRKIDDVFLIIENATADKADEVKNAVGSYMNRTAQGVAESLAGAVITPLEPTISSILGVLPENYTEDDIEELLLTQAHKGREDTEGGKLAEKLFKETCVKPLASEIYSLLSENLPSTDKLTSELTEKLYRALESAYGKLFSEISEKLKEYENAAAKELDNLSKTASEKLKSEATEIVNKYAEKLGALLGDTEKSRGTSVSSYSGLGMNYKDYLKLFALLELLTAEGKKDMMRRCMVVMQINCQSENAEFDIGRCYTGIELSSTVAVGAHKISERQVNSYYS